jgi:hypothetical protein
MYPILLQGQLLQIGPYPNIVVNIQGMKGSINPRGYEA